LIKTKVGYRPVVVGGTPRLKVAIASLESEITTESAWIPLKVTLAVYPEVKKYEPLNERVVELDRVEVAVGMKELVEY
jgi:hypothetical protein